MDENYAVGVTAAFEREHRFAKHENARTKRCKRFLNDVALTNDPATPLHERTQFPPTCAISIVLQDRRLPAEGNCRKLRPKADLRHRRVA